LLDFVSIQMECKIDEDVSSDIVVAQIANLEEFYADEDLILIYNYLLTQSKNADVLMNLIRFVDKFRDISSLTILVDLLLEKEHFVTDNLLEQENYVNLRAMCAKAIGNYKDTSAVTPLLYCLNNKGEHYRVRLACADSLGRIGDRFAVAPLIELVQDDNEKSVYVRESAASALGMIGDFRAIDPLVSILESNRGLIDKFTYLKERIIEALSRMSTSSDRVIRALKNSLEDESPTVRINAIEGLMNSEDERAVALIKSKLSDSDDEVKRNALIALYNLVGRAVLDEIIESPDYCEFLKTEAQDLIDEYETDEEEFYE